MSEETSESRVVTVLSTGTKICLIIAALLALAAAYVYLVPINLVASDGKLFGCGSAANPPTDPFPSSICGTGPTVYAYRAYALLAAAAVVAAAGYAFFGTHRTSQRAVPDGQHD